MQPAAVGPNDEVALLIRLRAGEERAYVALVERYHLAMIRLARTFVSSQAVAEEVAQEAWVGVLNGIARFEGRSTLKVWLMRIVTKQAIKRGVRERRSVPFSSLSAREVDEFAPAVDADAFLPAGHRWAGHWAGAIRPFPEPEEQLLRSEMMTHVDRVVETLPDAQRAVITLRDIEGWSADEVCEVLEISAGNQRVLLHRARSKVRSALDLYFHDGHK